MYKNYQRQLSKPNLLNKSIIKRLPMRIRLSLMKKFHTDVSTKVKKNKVHDIHSKV